MTYHLTIGQVRLLADVVTMADQKSNSEKDKFMVIAAHQILQDALGMDIQKVYAMDEDESFWAI
jgi:hypothetical protein